MLYTPGINPGGGTLQGWHPSPTLFNIYLEGFLQRLEKDYMNALGYTIQIQDGSVVQTNAAAYADGLILYSEVRRNMETMLVLLAQFCHHSKMKINAKKRVSISQVWSLFKKVQTDRDPEPFFIHMDMGDEDIPREVDFRRPGNDSAARKVWPQLFPA
jgi:hypothetical protein